jgi:hypothetical protein
MQTGKTEKQMLIYSQGFRDAINYLIQMQEECSEIQDRQTLQISIELLQGEYEMFPITLEKEKSAE